MMNKILITSGCSFSECISTHIDTWPRHLYRSLEQHGYDKHISCAMGSQGNGLISRGLMYEVAKALKTYKPEDILVGVMWSNSNRFDYRCEDTSVLSWGTENKHNWMTNPTAFVDGAPKNWVIGNLHWDSLEFATYLKYYHSHIGGAILSLEHILRTQYFLEAKKIPYFFTNFVDNNIVPEQYVDNDEVTYLTELLNTDQYLPVTSEHRWVVENSETKKEYLKEHDGMEWIHPKTHHHKEFVDKVIYPWLIQKNYI
jgi:hypothetical protein